MLLLLALSSIAVYGIMLAGWALGLEVPAARLGARLGADGQLRGGARPQPRHGASCVAGTLSTSGIVAAQDSFSRLARRRHRRACRSSSSCIAATAELNRPPFDLVEAEQELVGGFNTEYSSIRFALFFLAEFMNTITMSAVIVTLFFGGPQPRRTSAARVRHRRSFLGPLSGTVWFLLKLLVFLYMYVWFRATLPRLRYDQLMDLGWKVLIPLVARLVHAARRVPRRPATTAGTVVVVGVVGLVVLGRRLRRCCQPPPR